MWFRAVHVPGCMCTYIPEDSNRQGCRVALTARRPVRLPAQRNTTQGSHSDYMHTFHSHEDSAIRVTCCMRST